MKNELGKNVTAFKRLFKFPEIRTGWGLFAICFMLTLAVVVSAVYHPLAGFAMLAIAPVLRFKRDGMTADNIKYLEMLEKQFEGFPETMTKEEIEVQVKKFSNEEFEKRVTALLKDIDPEKLKALLSDDSKGIKAILLAQGEAITALKAGKAAEEEVIKSIRTQVKEWQTTNKDAIAKVKAMQSKDLPEFQLKVNSPMTPANTLGGSAYLPKPEYMPGVIDLVRIQPVFWDYITKGRTGSAAYVWINKTTPLGAAAWIAPGVLKPGVSFQLASEISVAKKIAASDKTTTELLDDIDGMTTFITQELQYQLYAKLNTVLMTSALSSTQPAGIQTVSVPFSAAGLATANPNNMDCIRAIVAQLRGANFGISYGPVTVFINPIDAANMDMAKASTSGVYILPPFVTADGRSIAGAIVVEDNNVPVGYIQAALLNLFKVLIYKDVTLTWGWENDDFTKNLITAIIEMRLHSFHSANYNGAFIYDTFANIKALIVAV